MEKHCDFLNTGLFRQGFGVEHANTAFDGRKIEDALENVLTAAMSASATRKRLVDAEVALAGKSGDCVLAPNWQERFFHIPPIDRDDVRKAPHNFIACLNDVGYRGVTSGTRSSCFVYFACTQWNVRRLEGRKRMLHAFGLNDETMIVNVASRLQPASSRDLSIVGHIDERMYEAYLHHVGAGPFAVRGYPSKLTQFTMLIEKSTPNPIAVITTGEKLFAQQRAILEEAFQAPVFDEYGCHETGISGYSLPQNVGFTLDWDRCFYEVVDGHLVTTDLSNTVMPIIRYKCGDMAALDVHDAGTPGTFHLHGRREDKVRTSRGISPVAAMEMPKINGVHSYAAFRDNDRLIVEANITGETLPHGAELQLARWSEETFGPIFLDIYSISPRSTAQHPKRPVCAEPEWCDDLCNGVWQNSAVDTHDPDGQLSEYAALFRNLVTPLTIQGSYGLTLSSRLQLIEQTKRRALADNEQEWLAARIMLLGVACMAPGAPERQDLLDLVRERLARAVSDLDGRGSIELDITDILLDDSPSGQAWTAQPRAQNGGMDRLGVHILLQALEYTWHRGDGGKQRHPAFAKLRPFMGVLLGDAMHFACDIDKNYMWVWRRMTDLDAPAVPDGMAKDIPCAFNRAWLRYRHALTATPQTSPHAFEDMQDAASTPEEHARCQMEEGYGALIAGEKLDALLWLDRFNLEQNHHPFDSLMIDPIPWLPILRAIAPDLFNLGRRAEAYQCLVASTAPSSRVSAFERISRQVNDKSSIMGEQQFSTR